MRCSEAPACLRRPLLLAAYLTSLAVSHPAARAEAPPAVQHEARKPEATNRLANETSPYLLQHAHNPVDWRPWGPESLLAAKDANKPIFLSVGYSSCYWCHVMEREVFENEEIAAYLNEHFICIKVDREERPDIDDQYMLALQLYFQAIGSSQGGGWPMSMFLTPEGKPFAGGTYFPAEDTPGIPGFRTVAEQIHSLWTTREAELRNNADFLATAVARHSVPGLALEKVELDKALVDAAVDAIMATYDPEHGGFYDPAAPEGPKFPEVPKLMLLSNWVFAHDIESESQSVQQRVAEVDHAVQSTLLRMAQGGIRDHVGGGFHRYSVDREWRVPHFEKMLYDQALLAILYWDEFGRTDNPLYRQVATEILQFVRRELTSPEGGFYSSLDAETDGIEGSYYVWSRDDISALFGSDEGSHAFAEAYGLNEESRFEHGHVLFNPRPLEQVATDKGLSLEELNARLADARTMLLSERTKRPALRCDEKILASWNGLMIAAFATAALWEPQPEVAAEYAGTAEQAANFVLNSMRDEEGKLLHCHAGGKAAIKPFLDDYAYVIWGLRELAEATQENATSDWQQIARQLQDQQNEMFWDERGHGFFYTGDAQEPLLTRTKDSNDSVMPSANAVSVVNLDALSRWPGVTEYGDLARQSLEVFAPALSKSPALLATTAEALRTYLTRPQDSVLPDGNPKSPSTGDAELALAPTDELVPTAEPSAEDARKHDKLTAAVYLSVDKVPAGGECNVALVLNVDEGWHINANPAQPKFLIPTELTAALPEKFELSDVRYPEGEEFKQQGADEPLVVYEGKVVLYGKLKAPASAAGKGAACEFTVRYQCCNDSECLRPMKLLLKGRFDVAAQNEQPQPVNQSLFKPKRPQPQ